MGLTENGNINPIPISCVNIFKDSSYQWARLKFASYGAFYTLKKKIITLNIIIIITCLNIKVVSLLHYHILVMTTHQRHVHFQERYTKITKKYTNFRNQISHNSIVM